MPNTKSAIRRVRRVKKQTQINRIRKSKYKNALKQMDLLIKSKGVYAYLLALIIGGALGNLFDRIYYKAVPDFIDLHLANYHWFIFNVADIFITLGIIGLLIVELTKREKISNNA